MAKTLRLTIVAILIVDKNLELTYNHHMEEQYILADIRIGKFYYSDKAMTILHREDGPAVECLDGAKYWYINGRRHHEDGPAVERADGSKKWFINGTMLTEKEFNDRKKSYTGKIVTVDGKKYQLIKV
jgi:hypothetical protein